jgi:hypothetical protein
MRLSLKVDEIKETLDNEEQKVSHLLQLISLNWYDSLASSYVNDLYNSTCLIQIGADIVKRALVYPLKLIAKNAGVNGSVVVEKVMIRTNFTELIRCIWDS